MSNHLHLFDHFYFYFLRHVSGQLALCFFSINEMPSYLFWNLAIIFSNSSLGSEKLKQNRLFANHNQIIRLYCITPKVN